MSLFSSYNKFSVSSNSLHLPTLSKFEVLIKVTKIKIKDDHRNQEED